MNCAIDKTMHSTLFEHISRDSLIADIEKSGINLYDLAIYKDGEIFEHRFQPCNNCNNCYSVAKVFTMTAVGMLQDEGLIDVKRPLRFYMGDLIPRDADPVWRLTTVENVLTHKLGLGKGFLDIDVEDVDAYPTDDYLDMVFHRPIVCLPGTRFQYSDAAFYLLSRLVSCVSGEKLDEFLNKRLFQPLDFKEAAWSRCPMDYPMGATGLYISAADAVKLAAVYMQRGLWQGKRIVSEDWVHRALGNEYELHVRTASGLIGKGGMYGQMMLLSREKQYAAAWHAHEPRGASVRPLVEYLDEVL